MKITDVEGIVLKSPEKYLNPSGSEEASGVAYCFLIKVSTDEGITGWSDVETAPQVAASLFQTPETGCGMMEGIRDLVIGEDPFDTERLWDKLYRGTIYYGRRGAAMQVMSGFDIACHDIIGKAIGRPVYKLLGGAYRDKVRAYASTLFARRRTISGVPVNTILKKASRRLSSAGAYSAKTSKMMLHL